ncbi:uncharacterized protein LOC115082569 [Rhinatrema bivittatum]|uniref:uncharacterized protein LOC115082569 n=1 Tax=Rhinatrema bivittatum TaxID=194408 RepID=UPI0011290D98|nr:uncharacterized protein LOC115082569 [Rhinatrema bivittatum]
MYQLWTKVLFCGLLIPAQAVMLPDPAATQSPIGKLKNGNVPTERTYGAVEDQSSDLGVQQYNTDRNQYGDKGQSSTAGAVNLVGGAAKSDAGGYELRILSRVLNNSHGAKRVARGLPIGVSGSGKSVLGGVTGGDSGNMLTGHKGIHEKSVDSGGVGNMLDEITISVAAAPRTAALLGGTLAKNEGLLGGFSNGVVGGCFWRLCSVEELLERC